MLEWFSKNKKCNLNECVEETFFRTMLIIVIIGSIIALSFDVVLDWGFSFNSILMVMFIVITSAALIYAKKIHFHIITIISLVCMDVLMTIRGYIDTAYYHQTCIILITIGFLCSITTRGRGRKFLKILIAASLLLILFENGQHLALPVLFRHAVPYCVIFLIVTISSGILKDRYEANQIKLQELIGLLNQKNAKIQDQHNKLLKSYEKMTYINEILEEKVKDKTFRIEAKNNQLSEIAFANAHKVRGPLARILGLLHLIEIDPSKKQDYLAKINTEALDMDEIIRVVGRSIEKNMEEQ
jgi:signal transduction histidine kinase